MTTTLAALTCEWCGETFERRGARGPVPRFCSSTHRWANHWHKDGFERARSREAQRRRRGTPPERYRRCLEGLEAGPSPSVDSQPFADWLHAWQRRHGATSAGEVGRRLGLSEKLVREVMDGKRPTVALSSVLRALDRTDTGLWELYPEEAAA